MWTCLILFSFSIYPTFSIISISEFGAIPNDNSTSVAINNGHALIEAFKAANNSKAQENRTVLVPAGNTFYFFNVSISNLYNVTLQIDGSYTVSNDIDEWIQILNKTGMINHLEDHPSSLYIQDSIGFELTGNGILDGQGHAWWYDFFNYVPHRDFRPYLFHMVRSKDVEIHNIHVRNSPCFHLNFYDMLNLHIHDLDIYVDFSSQQAMAEKRVWNWTGDFPANTDGIDLSGKNILVENVIIEVGDDGIAIKPANSRNMYSNCSQDMLIRNITTVYSLGMAVGSIGPDVSVNCIRNITFENIYHTYGSYRGFYIKTSNVGTGSGIVDNITVRNMTGYNNEAVFIYIGPMYQGPNANGSRCDGHWPTSLNATCDTQPLVSISNVLIENSVCRNCSSWMPGVLWCDPINKCKNLSIVNVEIDGKFYTMDEYRCQNSEGIQMDSNRIPDSCLTIVKNQSTTQKPATTPHGSLSCPNGWYNSKTNPNKCINFNPRPLVISEAFAECFVKNSRSTLLSITSAFENNEINQIAQIELTGCDSLYLGLTRNNSVWRWQNGVNSSYMNWDQGYPTSDIDNNCAIMKLSNGRWQNTLCNEYDCSVCQFLMN